ncbi:doublesex- and mab-3-related transcription factor B1 [Onychomys torridus]|uniref:doublesex- and mab-3-related transcription factor B1 n=1 Tax=Onychomys torridus TaxID=38674 RepID=UPI00167F7E6D|nr:doublesex- and mab-3-related transcription factor B1 [Onychomys torridus]
MLRTPKCSRCRNHGYLVPVKGHAGKCRWKQCICDKCYLITERQKIMAAQKVLKTQGAEEQAATAGTQGPQLPPGAPVAAPAAAAAASSSSLCPLPRVAPGGAGPGPVATCFLERPRQARSPGPSAFQLVPGGRPGPSTFQPGLGSPGGPHDRPPAWLPPASPQPPRPESCGPEQRLLVRPVPRPPFTDYDYGHPLRFSSDHVRGAGYPEREPFQQCPACVPMPSYQPFPPDGQDAASALGIPQQRSFRHVSCSPYHGGSLVSEPGRDLQPTYCSPPPPALPPPPPPPPPQHSSFLPSGYLSALHLLAPPPPPPSPPTFSLTILYDTDKEETNDQDEKALTKPSQNPSQERSN